MSTNKMILSLITRIGVHRPTFALCMPILVIKLKIILFVDNSAGHTGRRYDAQSYLRDRCFEEPAKHNNILGRAIFVGGVQKIAKHLRPRPVHHGADVNS